MYSSDDELERIIEELTEIKNHGELASTSAPSFGRIRDHIARTILELETLRSRPGEIVHTVDFRAAVPSVQISFSAFWVAIKAGIDDEGEPAVLNNLWVAVSYLEAGIVALLSAISDGGESPLNG